MGKEGKYDLKLAEPPPAAQPPTEDSDTEDDTGQFTILPQYKSPWLQAKCEAQIMTFTMSSIRYRSGADGEEQPPDSYDAKQHSQPAEDTVSNSWDLCRGVTNRCYTDPLWATKDACGEWS